jgi:hypothetical protein
LRTDLAGYPDDELAQFATELRQTLSLVCYDDDLVLLLGVVAGRLPPTNLPTLTRY